MNELTIYAPIIMIILCSIGIMGVAWVLSILKRQQILVDEHICIGRRLEKHYKDSYEINKHTYGRFLDGITDDELKQGEKK